MGKKKKEELPDYTVAKMDVDGMPWNSRRPWQILPGDPSKHRKEFDVKVPEPGMESDMPDNLSAFENPPMTKEERRGMIWLSLKASLTVGLIFGGAAFLFILFCVFVWLQCLCCYTNYFYKLASFFCIFHQIYCCKNTKRHCDQK